MKLKLAERIIAAHQRDALLGITSSFLLGGIDRFYGLDIGRLDQLLADGHADPMERQNDAPSIAEFREFIAKHPRFTVHGYAVSPHRDDYRMSVEGVELKDGYNYEELNAFKRMFSDADDVIIDNDRLFCWYD